MSGGLTDGEITRVVNRYIGVSHGYLGLPESNRFTYSSHADFYVEYCEIDVDLSQYQGTTREKFMKVLNSLPPRSGESASRGNRAISTWGGSIHPEQCPCRTPQDDRAA